MADYRALGAFRFALRRFMDFSDAGAQAQSLTPTQHQALLAIKAHAGAEPMSVGELADALLVKNHSALGLVDRLVERALVVRAPSSRDRRRVLLRLTPAGEKCLESISRNNLRELQSALPAFAELLRTLEELEFPAASASASGAESRAADLGESGPP